MGGKKWYVHGGRISIASSSALNDMTSSIPPGNDKNKMSSYDFKNTIFYQSPNPNELTLRWHAMIEDY